MKIKIATKFVIIILLLSSSCLITSCYKEHLDLNRLEKDGDWSPEIAIPFIYSDLSLEDILNDYDENNIIVDDGTGFLSLIYQTNLLSKKAEDILIIADQSVNTSFNFSVPGSLPFGTDITAPPFNVYYSFAMPNNAIIDEMDMKDGILDFLVFSPNLNHNATMNVSIPSATLNGIPFSRDINYIAGSASSTQLNLSGYKIVFDNTGGNQNRLTIIYTVTLHGSGAPNNSPYSLSMGESFKNMKFSKLSGDLKQIIFDFPQDTIEIKLFTNNIDGMIDLEDPMIHLYAYNSFGMPVRIDFNYFAAISGLNPPYTVTIINLPTPWNINEPTVLGDIAMTSYHLDKNNSNIWDALAIFPKYFVTDISGLSNPSGGVSSNFALDTSRLKVDAQVEIPLFGRVWDFILQDTVNAEFGLDMDNIEYILFRINTTNGFPVEAIQQLYFLNDLDQIIDSLLTPEQQIMAPAPCSGPPDYKVTQSVNKLTETRFETARLKPLEQCKKIVIRAKLATTEAETKPVKIYSDYNLNLRVGLKTKFKVNY